MLRLYRTAFHHRQKISLNPFSAHIRSSCGTFSYYFIDLVNKDDPFFFSLFYSFPGHFIHIYQLLSFLCLQYPSGLGNFHSSSARFFGKDTSKHLAYIDTHRIHSATAYHWETDLGTFLNFNFNFSLSQFSLSEHGQKLAPRRFPESFMLLIFFLFFLRLFLVSRKKPGKIRHL